MGFTIKHTQAAKRVEAMQAELKQERCVELVARVKTELDGLIGSGKLAANEAARLSETVGRLQYYFSQVATAPMAATPVKKEIS